MLLGLDLGTTNVKALVSDLAGRRISSGSSPVSLFRLRDGGVEQDVEELWRATRTAMRQALASVDAGGVAAVGVSSQGGALQVLDPEGRPLGRVISWLDQRCRPYDAMLNEELGRDWFRQRIAHGGSWLSVGQVLRLRREQPGLVDAPNRLGFVGDILVSRLCGRAVQDRTSAALTLFYNPRRRAYDPELLQRLGLEAGQLPSLGPVRAAAGGLLPEVAQETGMRPGIPVSVAVHDQYASALGTGAVEAGTTMIGTGTAWVLLVVGDRLLRPLTDDAFVCHHVVDGLWGQILSMVNGGSAVTWALEITGLSGRDGPGIDSVLEEAAPGSDGVWCWPYMTPFGATGLEPGTAGRLAGLQLSHRAPQLLRAVVEGLAYELNRHLEFVRDRGQAVNRLVMGGGAAGSRVTPQIIADVTGMPLRCYAGVEASLAGAVVLARGLLEPGMSLEALAEVMRSSTREIRPGPDRAFYEAGYRKYRSSLPLSREGR
ncbi:MAG TPA: FGGY-family carbohydrate kinase [Verrucomicrobiota bacterium]|nr:FGGY-family carbohydrate kinase [Verrucomicrobiota bacterium]HNU53051.1 FGGY-family carbohydrate kinase [Verrucomicrobiota bacterium]